MSTIIDRAILRRALAEIAVGEIGKREVGSSNRGPDIDKYFAAADCPAGNPWCACFVAWCIRRLGEVVGMTLDWPYSAYVPDLANWGKKHGVAHTGTAEIGSVMCQWHADMGRYAHTGIVVRTTKTTVYVVEGNTNTGGSRNGTSVLQQRRDLSERYLYVDFLRATSLPEVVDIIHGDKTVGQGSVLGGSTYVFPREFADVFGVKVGFARGHVTINGNACRNDKVIGSVGFVPLRDMVHGNLLTYDRDAHTVTVAASP